MKNPIWFVFWLLVFVFISFIVAFFCSFLYVFIFVLVVCIPALSNITDLLLQGLQFPHYCARAMMDCKSLC